MNLVPKKKRVRRVKPVAEIEAAKDCGAPKVPDPDVEGEADEGAELIARCVAFNQFIHAARRVAEIIEQEGIGLGLGKGWHPEIHVSSGMTVSYGNFPTYIEVRIAPEGLERLNQRDPRFVDESSLRLIAAVHLALISAKT